MRYFFPTAIAHIVGYQQRLLNARVLPVALAKRHQLLISHSQMSLRKFTDIAMRVMQQLK